MFPADASEFQIPDPTNSLITLQEQIGFLNCILSSGVNVCVLYPATPSVTNVTIVEDNPTYHILGVQIVKTQNKNTHRNNAVTIFGTYVLSILFEIYVPQSQFGAAVLTKKPKKANENKLDVVF